jgi:hypothetical protein
MITEEQKLEIVKALKPHTRDSVYENGLKRLPVIINSTEVVPIEMDPDNTYYEYKNNVTTSVESTRTVETINTSTGKTETSEESYTQYYGTKKYRLTAQTKFHYNDTWYNYKYSAEEPQFTFGIIKVDNLPYRSFNSKRNKKSFICTMNDLIYNGYCEPFMIFIDGLFVNWNVIHVVFDCDDTYLLLYGEKYNWFNLREQNIQMIVLPYHLEYIGSIDSNYFDMMYEVTKSCLQDSLKLNDEDKITITLPAIEDIYNYRGMIYNVGAWLYTQQKNYYLGLLNADQVNKLKKIELVKYEYDISGNIVSSITTKFNALDRDSCPQALYDRLTCLTREEYQDKAIINFNDDGELIPNTTVVNAFALLDDTISVQNFSGSGPMQTYTLDNDNFITTDNFITFFDGRFRPEMVNDLAIYQNKYIKIENLEVSKRFSLFFFKLNNLEKIEDIEDNFNKSYINSRYMAVKYGATQAPSDIAFANLIDSNKYYLNYSFNNTDLYEEQVDRAKDTILEYDVRKYNKLYHTNIECISYTGEEISNNLISTLGYESRRGLKLPRSKYENHESYVIVFENGELLPEYSRMIVYPNFFFIPIDEDREFAVSSKIELMYLNMIDNNEISFEMTDYMLEHMPENDSKWRQTDIFSKFIRPEDLKIFHNYPTAIIRYPTLVEPSDNIAFNVSYRVDGDLYIKREVSDLKEGVFTAVSSRKFIYQRLYADKKAYRIELDKRFRYCDNIKQYVLFINGRRMDDDTFLVTIPKWSRPFWGMYIYLTKFVGPEDRVELFYLPEELNNTNIDEAIKIKTTGYIETTRSTLEVPYDSRLYLFFINGKKIPSDNLISVDSSRLRLSQDTRSTNDLVINRIYTDTIPEIVSYMAGNTNSKYDKFIHDILSNPESYTLLDRMLNQFIQITDIEEDKTRNNVAKIAIINEIIRDFWVTSGYHYNDEPFVYDYDIDDLYMPTDDNGNVISPALDANQFINILKNDFHLVYFYANVNELVEIGTRLTQIIFNWEFCQNLYNENNNIINQSFTYHDITQNIGLTDRQWTYSTPTTTDTTFVFNAATPYQKIQKKFSLTFVNGIYYGNVDEDILQDIERDNTVVDFTDVMALVPKDGIIQPSTYQEAEDPAETALIYREQNYVIEHLGIREIKYIPDDSTLWSEDSIVTMSDHRLYAITPESEEFKDLLFYNCTIEMPNFLSSSDFQHILGNLNKSLQIDPVLDLENYVIGNNNYFVYSCPKRLAYDENSDFMLEFVLPDPNSDDVKAHCRDDKTTPIYTSGEGWDDYEQKHQLIPLDYMEMVYLGEFLYTNSSGYTEPYCFWRTNGFFTRLFDDYGFSIKIRFRNKKKYDDGLGHIIGG